MAAPSGGGPLTTMLLPWLGWLLALALGVLQAVQFLIARRESRPHLKVALRMGMSGHPDDMASEPLLIVEIVNSGSRPVPVQYPTLQWLGHAERFVPERLAPEMPIPRNLAQWARCRFSVEAFFLGDSFRERGMSERGKLVAAFTDPLGGEHRSKPLVIQAGEMGIRQGQ